ncbi:phytanoyl-CoA dioxygenase family protein [Novosphingobium beihaiensis]|uniref:Phytanoyl-CoA dioxygenase family protein n=1 Tax=Novosphingobium beihaiensis TaxID=2930389 RepID=A0ABT0BPP9_9SPHN|nr:phytanoyl-CoA dioxygenase family protein [Novosphingobium beihaiensis]MCJ2187027.1 phytanoyl-CoA dioxygenase family protein [Novosphingobium beihaiensis]
MTRAPDLSFAAVRGLEDFWTRGREGRRATPEESHADKVMLSALGIGIGEVLSALYNTELDFPAFCGWIAANAGAPDTDRIARYHAWRGGAPLPSTTRATLDAIDAMAAVLSSEDLAHWDEHGFIVVPGAISPDEAAAAERALWEALNASPRDPASWPCAETEGIWVNLYHHPAMEPARRSARAFKAFAQLWGTADLWPTIDRLGFNPPVTKWHGYRGGGIHWDVSLARPIPFGTQGILYLTDTAADQGALRVVPGFHRTIDSWLDGEGREDPRSHDFTAQARPIPAGAGDLVIWHHALPHDASPNRSQKPRLVQYLNMFSADVPANPIWL